MRIRKFQVTNIISFNDVVVDRMKRSNPIF